MVPTARRIGRSLMSDWVLECPVVVVVIRCMVCQSLDSEVGECDMFACCRYLLSSESPLYIVCRRRYGLGESGKWGHRMLSGIEL